MSAASGWVGWWAWVGELGGGRGWVSWVVGVGGCAGWWAWAGDVGGESVVTDNVRKSGRCE